MRVCGVFDGSFVMRRSQVRAPSPAPYEKPCIYRIIAVLHGFFLFIFQFKICVFWFILGHFYSNMGVNMGVKIVYNNVLCDCIKAL